MPTSKLWAPATLAVGLFGAEVGLEELLGAGSGPWLAEATWAADQRAPSTTRAPTANVAMVPRAPRSTSSTFATASPNSAGATPLSMAPPVAVTFMVSRPRISSAACHAPITSSTAPSASARSCTAPATRSARVFVTHPEATVTWSAWSGKRVMLSRAMRMNAPAATAAAIPVVRARASSYSPGSSSMTPPVGGVDPLPVVVVFLTRSDAESPPSIVTVYVPSLVFG